MTATNHSILQHTRDLIEAAKDGDHVAVERLIPLASPKAYDSMALVCAAAMGHSLCVQLLAPVSDPQANNDGALNVAMAGGHLNCVKLLVPHVGRYEQLSAFFWFLEHDWEVEAERLYPLLQPFERADFFRFGFISANLFWERCEHIRLRVELQQATAGNAVAAKKRKI